MTDTFNPFRALCAELIQLVDEELVDYSDWKSRWSAATSRARTELFQTSSEDEMTENSFNSLPKNYIDPEHCGEDRNLLETFYTACKSEGGTSDEITLRGLRAVLSRWGYSSSALSIEEGPIKVDSCLTDEELLNTYGQVKRNYYYEGPIDDWPNREEREATIAGLRAIEAAVIIRSSAAPYMSDLTDEARYLAKELRDQADDLNPSLELFGLIHRAADLVEELSEENKRLQSLNDTLAKCLDEQLCCHPIPVPQSEGEVAKLVSAVHAAYAAYGWVEEKQFIRFFDEVSRLASVIEEGCDCSVDGPINWQAEIELMCQRLKPVPVSERLPEPKNCIPHPRTRRGNWCWGFERCDVSLARPARWRLMHMETIEMEASHWISGQDLPIPSVEVEE